MHRGKRAVVLLIILLVIRYTKPTKKTGFYCKDPQISHVFTGETISWKVLLVVSYFGTLILITIAEYNLEDVFSNVCRNVWHWYRDFALGGLLNLTIVEFFKNIVAEPRPHFLDTCSPDKHFTCLEGTFVNDYVCMNNDYVENYHSDLFRSFPSGHTSLAVYTGLFCVMYLNRRLSSQHFGPGFKFLQLQCIGWTICCSISRIVDRRHHWRDVLAGCIIGILTANYVVKSLCKNFRITESGSQS